MKKILIITALILFASIDLYAETYYVDSGKSDVNNGTSWATAEKTLQAALADATAPGDEIWVKAGTHYPDEDGLTTMPHDNGQDALRREVAFVDASVPNLETLIQNQDPCVEVYLLDGSAGGFSQITGILTGQRNIDALHIFSHGSEGRLTIGTDILTTDNMAARSGDLARIGRSLSEDGDLLLYGCDVAKGEVGAAFVSRLAELTGADVAASTDVTGATNLGGDWDLEVRYGAVEAAVIESAGFTGLLTDYALDFDGSNDYVDCGNDSSLQITGSITIQAWIKAGSWNDYAGIVAKHIHGGSKFGYQLRNWVTGDTTELSFSVGNDWNDWNYALSSLKMDTGTWYHVAGTYDGSTIKVYINGVEKGSTSFNNGITDSGTDLNIGSDVSEAPRPKGRGIRFNLQTFSSPLMGED